MCGHREYDADFLDKRAFGFPFDRNLDFELDNNKRYIIVNCNFNVVLLKMSKRFWAKRKIKILFNQMTQERLGRILDEQQQEPETTTREAVTQDNSSEEISGIDHDDHYDSPDHEHYVKYQKLRDHVKPTPKYTTEKTKPKQDQSKKEKKLVGTYESQNYDLKIFAKQSNITKNKTPQEWLDVIKKFRVS